MSSGLTNNPFKVFSPERMSAIDAVDLFVEVSEFNKVQDQGNTMLNGPRGSGKSMLFRYLMPDCQKIARGVPVCDLPFFAVLVSVKNTEPDITEFRRLDDDQYTKTILSDHLLTSFVSSKLFQALIDAAPADAKQPWIDATMDFYMKVLEQFRLCGAKFGPGPPLTDCRRILKRCKELCERSYTDMTGYAKRLPFGTTAAPYDGALCDYSTFLFPVIESAQTLPYLPDAAFYLLIDDAGYLSLDQTKVLNSWIATRNESIVSIKISTQYDYQTFSTFSGRQIQSPHDFQVISIADVYTSRNSTYVANVTQMVNRRLEKAGIKVDAKRFFPKDEEQESRIRAIGDDLRRSWHQRRRGYRPSDDVLRYARPDFIRSLGGAAKSTSTYSYAGFEQLVHISSGQVRYFLEPAAVMYDEQKATLLSDRVAFIPPGTQDSVIRSEAESLMFKDDGVAAEVPKSAIERLRNLIRFLGGLFFQKLISTDAERRVFSVAVSGDPDKDVLEIFEMGVIYGYFHRSSIGNKEGTGRTRLYVLTRRLAPHFKLDPSAFSGYQFITNSRLRHAMNAPDSVLRRVKEIRQSGRGFDELAEDSQLDLF